MESSKTELLEERQKWQRLYQPVHENHLDSLLDNRLGSRDPDNKRDSGVRELNFDDPPSPTIDQVYTETIFLCLVVNILKSKFRVQFGDVRGELETLKRLYKSVQSEKEELEHKFSQLQDNYSLLSSQSRTVRNGSRKFVFNYYFLLLVCNLLSQFYEFLFFHFCFYFECKFCFSLGWSLGVYGTTSRSRSGGPHSF